MFSSWLKIPQNEPKCLSGDVINTFLLLAGISLPFLNYGSSQGTVTSYDKVTSVLTVVSLFLLCFLEFSSADLSDHRTV